MKEENTKQNDENFEAQKNFKLRNKLATEQIWQEAVN